MSEVLDFGQAVAVQDLQTYLRRARAIVPAGAARFIGQGGFLSVYVSAGERAGAVALGLRI
ncbi:MAG: hypothetical protein ACRC0L_05000, partial [Angustibacter sp.]